MKTPRRPTRLLLVTNMYPTPDVPDAGNFVARRVAALQERGVDVVVAGPADYRGSSALRHARIAWRALTARGPFDGVEAHAAYAAGVIGLAVARLRRRPLVAYSHGGDVAEDPDRSRLGRMLVGWVIRGSGAVVANSRDTAGYVERLGRSAAVVSPGVDMALFRPLQGDGAGDSTKATGAAEATDRVAALRRRLGLPEGLLALFMGTLSERKGPDVFAAGIEAAAARGGNWHGVMVGDGPLASDLAAGHPSILRFRTVLPDDVPDWLRAADVVVVPSRREPLGLAAVEALACGRPVVASATGGLLEVVRDGENGLLVPPGDAAAIGSALIRLADPELRARLGRAGPASVARHDVHAAAAAMAEVWAELGVMA